MENTTTNDIRNFMKIAGVSKETRKEIIKYITTLNKVEKMREVVKFELEHIPRGNYNQNKLRETYWKKRMSSLKGLTDDELKWDMIKLIFSIEG